MSFGPRRSFGSRLEQWARIAGDKGEVPLYIFGRGEDRSLQTITVEDEWCREALLVMEGAFTVEDGAWGGSPNAARLANATAAC